MNKPVCLRCGFEKTFKSRGLCATCYQWARRHDEIVNYPTDAMLEDPDNHARIMFNNFSGSLMDVAKEYGFKVVRTTY